MVADCPVCKIKGSLRVKTITEEIPYFGEVMETTLLCSECGYKHSDIICLEAKEPVQYSLKVDKSKMNVRVVKSQSATINIPELGVKVEPGPQSQGYVSNIEGVLNRFEKAVQTAFKWAENENTKKNALNLLDDIEKIKNGEKKVTLIIQDPFGHSLVEDKEADKKIMEEDELKNLKTGFLTFEKG